MPKVYLYVCDEILFDNLWVFHDHESLGLSWQFKKKLNDQYVTIVCLLTTQY